MKRIILSKGIILFLVVGSIIFNGTSVKAVSEQKRKSIKISNADIKISIEKAKELALSHSKVPKKDARITKIRLDKENKLFIYEIEFYTENKKYKYDIDANTGKILSYSYKEREAASTIVTDPGKPLKAGGQNTGQSAVSRDNSYIGIEKAKEIAVSRVSGAKKINVIRIQLDKKKGKEIYEGKLVYRNTEYEFDIDALTGDILSWEVTEK